MRRQSIALLKPSHALSTPLPTPSHARLCVFWPRYLHVRAHGAKQEAAKSQALCDWRSEKRYSTVIWTPRAVDGQAEAAELLQTSTVTDQGQPPGRTYDDPSEYLEDDGDAIPENIVAGWRRSLADHPATYNLAACRAWEECVRRSPRIKFRRHGFLEPDGDWQPDNEWQHRLPYKLSETLGSPWHRAYFRLQAAFDLRLQPHLRVGAYLGDPRAEIWSRPFLQVPPGDTEMMRSLWLNLDPQVAIAIWPHCMLYVMHTRPERVLDVQTASMAIARQTSGSELVFSYMTFYAEQLLQGPERVRLFRRLRQFLRILPKFQEDTIHGTFDRAIYLHLRECDLAEDVSALYEDLMDGGLEVSCYTHLRVATMFADAGKHPMALEALERAVSKSETWKNLAQSRAFHSACNKLLRTVMDSGDGYQASLRVLSKILELGVELTRPLNNVLILNAAEAGDTATAVGLYDSALENGFPRNAYTYEFTLRALLDCNEAELVERVVNQALDFDGPGKFLVWNQALRCIAGYYLRQSRTSAFARLVEIFRARFHVDALVKLKLVPVNTQDLAAQDPNRILRHLEIPDTATVYIMLHHYLVTDPEPARVVDSWNAFMSTRHEDTVMMECSRSAYFYTAFIKALGRTLETLHLVPVVLNAILQPPATPALERYERELGRPYRQPKPNQWMLNTMLHAFARHGRIEAAEQVRSVMRERGVEEDPVTWQTLATGYARVRDLDSVAKCMRKLDVSGGSLGPSAMRNLRLLLNRRARGELLASRGRAEESYFEEYPAETVSAH